MGLIVPPVTVPITLYQGATFRREFVWKIGPDEATAAPVDLTGCQARAQVRETHPATTVLASMTTENGGITLGGTAGTVALYLSDEATTLLPALPKPARWDLEIVWPDGDVTRLFEGAARISPEVTRD